MAWCSLHGSGNADIVHVVHQSHCNTEVSGARDLYGTAYAGMSFHRCERSSNVVGRVEQQQDRHGPGEVKRAQRGQLDETAVCNAYECALDERELLQVMSSGECLCTM